ncbi:MAG TPA: VOC family protein [Pyrinomonadaceae bacterium]|nr:VOC family protein [Pyrinomonadaceae bacterium]
MEKRVTPMIHVPDVRATVEWYQNIGFEVVATYGDGTGENFSFAIVSFGTTRVMFNCEGEPSDKGRREVDLYVYTDNVDELYQTLKDRVDVIDSPCDRFYGMRELIIRDLNRFWITFGQESLHSLLMSGIYEGEAERVRKALDSGAVKPVTLNVALAFASVTEKSDAQIVEMLTTAGAQPLPEVDLATLESYAGSYKGEHGAAAEVTMKDGRLFVTPAGDQTMSLWPLDQRTFTPVAMAGAMLTFEVENGKTLGLILNHEGHPVKLNKQSTDYTDDL